MRLRTNEQSVCLHGSHSNSTFLVGRILMVLGAWCFAIQLCAQLNRPFVTYTPLRDSSVRQLRLHLQAVPFAKNNEYFGELTQGFTGLGVMLRPSISYQPGPNTRLDGGLFYRHYAGRNIRPTVQPLFTLRQRLTDSLELVMGSLYGALNHRLEEPVYRFDRYYRQNVEYGLQLLLLRHWWQADVWVDWQEFIQPGDTIQEAFVGGWVNAFAYRSGRSRWAVPTQLLVYHRGGQINDNPDGVLSLLNASAGLKYTFRVVGRRQLHASALCFLNRTLAAPLRGPNAQSVDGGRAVYLRAGYTGPHWQVRAGYWQAYNFAAPFGEPLFHSVSDFDATVLRPDRRLWTGKLAYTHRFGTGGVSLQFRFETYYDPTDGNFSFSNGLFLVLNEGWLLHRF